MELWVSDMGYQNDKFASLIMKITYQEKEFKYVREMSICSLCKLPYN